jgi:hypothetical protein
VAFVAIESREPLAHEGTQTDPVSVQLDVLRRDVEAGGLLAGEAVLWVPTPTVLGGLTLTLAELRATRALWGVRSTSTVVRQACLIGRPPQRGWRRWVASSRARGLYAPGRYRARFRLPLGDLPPTCDAPGASAQRRYSLSLRLDRPGGAFEASLEVLLRSRFGALQALTGSR